jgi:protease IV
MKRAVVLSVALLAGLVLCHPVHAQKADKKGRVVHEVKLAGAYQDLPEVGGLGIGSLLGGSMAKPKSFYELIDDLKALEKDKTKEVVFDLSDTTLSLNFAQIEELGRAIASLRNAGTKTVAYLEGAGVDQYLVASLCERIVMADMGIIDIPAPAMSVLFMKDALDLLGVQVQIARAGDFKGAVEPFVLSEMSPHLRSHYLDMVKSMNARIVSLISEQRKLEPEKVRELQGRRLISAKDAREAGLVDETCAWKGSRCAIQDGTSATFQRVGKKKEKPSFNIFTLFSGSTKSEKGPSDDCHAVLHLSGVIVDGEKEAPGSIVSGPTVALIKRLQGYSKVKGVVVRVNSPGGSATASEAILLALRELAEAKPVVVSMGEVAASGGYYVAMAGGTILAEHNTITGSIGVFGMRPNVGALARRIGIRNELIALDDSASMNDIFRPLGEPQLESLQSHVLDVYDRFRARILEARKSLTDESLKAMAGGRVWSGQQAVELGLVDRLGGLREAVAILAEKTTPDLPLVSYPEVDTSPFAMLERMLDVASLAEPNQLRMLRAAGFDLSGALRILMDAIENPSAVRVWAMLPFELRVK